MEHPEIIAILDQQRVPSDYYFGYTVPHTDVSPEELARAHAEIAAEWARRVPDAPAPAAPCALLEVLHLASGRRAIAWLELATFPADPSATISALIAQIG